MLSIQRFDPAPCGFAAPRRPILPPAQLRREAWTLRGRRHDAGLRWYARGRYALNDAYAAAGLRQGGVLHAPAYHCRTMIDAAIAHGIEVRLYPLREDLTIDRDALRPAMEASRGRPQALLATHYFGRPQPLDDVAALCREHGATLIEDCSHALPAAVAPGGDRSIGQRGDFAIASPYKFFPSPDGGVLWQRQGDWPAAPRARGRWREELSATVHVLRVLCRLTPAADLRDAGSVEPHEGPPPRLWDEAATAPSEHYQAQAEADSALRLSRWIVAHTDVGHLAARRRQRQAQWLERVQPLRHCHALHPKPLGAEIPYMFALVLHRPQADFARLKRWGVPIWRWDEMARSDCAVAQRYRFALIHLPCHQGLDDQAFEWMADAVERVCGQ
jgi:perosamine synthetase